MQTGCVSLNKYVAKNRSGRYYAIAVPDFGVCRTSVVAKQTYCLRVVHNLSSDRVALYSSNAPVNPTQPAMMCQITNAPHAHRHQRTGPNSHHLPMGYTSVQQTSILTMIHHHYICTQGHMPIQAANADRSQPTPADEEPNASSEV